MCELLADLALEFDECAALDLPGRRWFGSPSRSASNSFSSDSPSPDPDPPPACVILKPVSGSIVSSGRDASSLRDVSERFGGFGLSAALYASRIHSSSQRTALWSRLSRSGTRAGGMAYYSLHASHDAAAAMQRRVGNEASLGYRGVVTQPLTSHNDGGIDLKKIAPKARVY